MSTLAHLVGRVAGVAAAELVAGLSGDTGPIDALSRFIADRLPLAAVELAVFRLHRRDKVALRLASASILVAAAAGALGACESFAAWVRAAVPSTRMRTVSSAVGAAPQIARSSSCTVSPRGRREEGLPTRSRPGR